jgi:hypothetical protein
MARKIEPLKMHINDIQAFKRVDNMFEGATYKKFSVNPKQAFKSNLIQERLGS